MKAKTEAKALDKAVKALAKVTQKTWSGYTSQQQTQKLQDLKKLMASFSARRRGNLSSEQSV